MNSETISTLNTLLAHQKASASFQLADLPEDATKLTDSRFLVDEVRKPTQCPHSDCSASCSVERTDEKLQIICDLDENPHEKVVPADEYRYYKIAFKPIIREIAQYANHSIEEGSFDDSTLPGYVSAQIEEDVQIVLLVSPSNYQQTAASIYLDALSADTPTLLVTPEQNIDPLLTLQSLFACGSLVFIVPFTILEEDEEYIQKPVNVMKDIQEMEQEFINKRTGEDTHPLVYRANSNPRYILTELNHMRLLRVNKEIPDHSGTRLEKVGEVAFSHLFPAYPESGGEDDRGKELPDQLFYIPPLDSGDKYESIFGIIDSKSGDEAGFGDEEAEGKHDVYLEEAEGLNINTDNIAHVFLILEFDGQQELEFHKKIAEEYEKSDKNEYMVIITADALAMLLAAYLAASVSNELQLIYGDFRKAIYPLFHDEKFKESDLGRIEREVGQEKEEYRDEYLQRDDLLIIHRGVIREQLNRCLESPKEIEDIFEQYFKPSPSI